jgi:hypothetical protein
MSVLEMAAGAVEEPRPVTDTSLVIGVIQRPTIVQPKVPKPLQENPAEANRFLIIEVLKQVVHHFLFDDN